MIDHYRMKVDAAIAAAAVASPVWIGNLQTGVALATSLAGLIYLTIRIMTAWKEYKAKK